MTALVLGLILGAVCLAYVLGWRAGGADMKRRIRSGLAEMALLEEIRRDALRRQQECPHPHDRRAVREGRGVCLDCGAGVDHYFPDSWDGWTPG